MMMFGGGDSKDATAALKEGFESRGISVREEDLKKILGVIDKLPQELKDALVNKNLTTEEFLKIAEKHGDTLTKIPELQEVLPKLIEAAKEARQAGKALRDMYANGDGKIEATEYNASTPDQKAAAARADLNKNGILERNEMAAVLEGLDPKTFENFRKNVEQKNISLNTGPTAGVGAKPKSSDVGQDGP
jgi:hypothetical protein